MAPDLRVVLCVLQALLLSWPACTQRTVSAAADDASVNATFTTNLTADRDAPFTGSAVGSAWNSTLDSDSNSHAVTKISAAGQSTPGIPDVTATSQRIILQTTVPSVDSAIEQRSTNGTFPTEAIPRPTSNSSSAVTDYTLQAERTTVDASSTATRSLAVESNSSATTTTEYVPVDVSVEGNYTAEGVNGTAVDRLVLLTFNGTCDYDSSSINLEGLEKANAVVPEIGKPFCESQVRLRLSVSNVSDLDRLVGVLQLRTHESVLTLSAVEFPDKSGSAGTQPDQDEGFVTRLFAGPFSTREILTYAVVGGVFGLAIVLVSALLCCKCLCGDRRRKRSQDIPHLTLRLEDYSLTRIPRPNTLFGGGGGGGPVRNGTAADSGRARVRQSIDTSVVPMDEEYGSGSLHRGGLRSFSGRRLGNKSAGGTVDEEDAQSRCSPALTGSTERLARDFGNRQPKKGNENKNFRF